MVTPMLAEMCGSIQVGLAGLGSAIGVGLVGMKASEAVGRNPGAFGKVIRIGVAWHGAGRSYRLLRAFPGGTNSSGAGPLAPRQHSTDYESYNFIWQHRQ